MAVLVRGTVSQTFLDRVKSDPDHVAFQYKPAQPDSDAIVDWQPVTFKEFYQEARLVSFGLRSLGVHKGDKVAILSHTRFEWSLSDMAILGAGAVTVPIYPSNTEDDVAYILNNSESKVVILEDAKQLEKVLQKKSQKELAGLKKIIVIDPRAMRLAADGGDVLTLQALRELGKREEARDPSKFDDTLSEAEPDDVITICYTSGTTGVPKGAMITHDNMMSVLEDVSIYLEKFIVAENEILLTFLPFSHILGKVESMTVYAFGWRLAFAENLDRLMANIAEVKPTLLLAVPRIFEKAYSKINATVDTGPKFKRDLFHWGFEIGREYFRAIWGKKSPPLKTTAQYMAAKTLVFSKIANRFGGRLRFAVSGGAPLPKEVGEFFEIVGIKILEGYGLTETTGPISLNLPDDTRFGIVGRPLPDVSVKIADDGEILVKSRKVFKGYYKMPKETHEVLHDGWFKTGDIGHIDQDGFLHITDRKKDLIITSGGKNVAPQKIENLAKSKKLVTQFVVVGDNRNYLTALITLDREQIIHYANRNQILFSEYSELIKNPKIISMVQKVVDEVNQSLASFETIKKFLILPNDFTVETGELTPSLKVKRAFINKQYKSELDSLYA